MASAQSSLRMISAARLGMRDAPSMPRLAAHPRLRPRTWRGTRRIRGVDALCVCGEFVCLRSNVFILMLDSLSKRTRSHTTRPPRPVARSRRADTARTRLLSRRAIVPTHRLSAAWKSSHTVKTTFRQTHVYWTWPSSCGLQDHTAVHVHAAHRRAALPDHSPRPLVSGVVLSAHTLSEHT